MTELTFDPGLHEYHVAKRKVPGVTSCLDPYSGYDQVDPDELRAAAEFGTHVHDAIDLLNRGELNRLSLTEAVEAYVTGWEYFLDDSGFVVVESELRVYHPKLGYAGTLDVVGNFPDHKELALVDIKTSAGVPKTVGPQTAAYAEAYALERRRRKPRRYCVHVGPNKYNLVPLIDVRDFDIFKAALTLHKWQTGE